MSNEQPEENSRGIARVTFRVRCETLGHGEMVYLSRVGDASGFRVSCEVVMSICWLIGWWISDSRVFLVVAEI